MELVLKQSLSFYHLFLISRVPWVTGFYYGVYDDTLYIYIRNEISREDAEAEIIENNSAAIQFSVVRGESSGINSPCALADRHVADDTDTSAEAGHTGASAFDDNRRPHLRPGSKLKIGTDECIYTMTLAENKLGLTVGHVKRLMVIDRVCASNDGIDYATVGKCEYSIHAPLSHGPNDVFADFSFIEVDEGIVANNNNYRVEASWPTEAKVEVEVLTRNSSESGAGTGRRGILCTRPFTWKPCNVYNAHYVVDPETFNAVTVSGDSGAPVLRVDQDTESRTQLPVMVTAVFDLLERKWEGLADGSRSLTLVMRLDDGLRDVRKHYFGFNKILNTFDEQGIWPCQPET